MIAHIADVNQSALQKFIETLQLKAHSPNTIRTYVNAFAQLLYFLDREDVNEVHPEQRKYCTIYKPTDILFEGQFKNEPYSTRSLQQIFLRPKNASKIVQPVTFHSHSHSYATGPTFRHLHERGTDVKLIQELPGHSDIQTTMRYTHVSNLTIEKIESPSDQLNLKKE